KTVAEAVKERDKESESESEVVENHVLKIWCRYRLVMIIFALISLSIRTSMEQCRLAEYQQIER
ncbi:MAG TPA: hypothetical protein PLP16_13015, partial [Smithellaceae bacterium]|nr:hypothetical protein [Smithellaceae bacterium]